MTGAISIVNPLILSNWFASDLWRKWKHVRRREILLTDDVRAWIPPGDPHGQRNPPKLEGPERSQSGNEERGDADSTKKAHNTNLAWERAAHLQGFLRNNSLYCLLIWWRFLHVFRFSLSLFFFFLFSKVSQKTDSYKLTQKLSFPRSPTNYYPSTITWKQENPQVGFLLSFPLFFISLVMMIREQEIMVPAPHGQRNENSKAVSFNPAVKEYRCTHLSCAPPSSSSNCKKLMKFSITFPSAEPKREQHMDGYWKTS